MRKILSTNNAKIKYLIQLKKKSSVRKEFKEFVIEGIREIKAALNSAYRIKQIYFYPELFDENKLFKLIQSFQVEAEIVKISKNVYQKIAYRGSTGGLIALAEMKAHRLNHLQLSTNPYLLVAEGIEKPGNVGAMLRSVDGAGADALILANPKLDIYNPNLIRASLGMLFSIPVAVCDLDELKDFLKTQNIDLYAAGLQNANLYFKENYTYPTAIAVGAEDKGLSMEIKKLAKQQIYIPMKGQVDSLNVSVSAAVLLYEIVRQRDAEVN